MINTLFDKTIIEIQHILEDYFILDSEGDSKEFQNAMNQIKDVLYKFLQDLNKNDYDWRESTKEKAALYNQLAQLRERLAEKTL